MEQVRLGKTDLKISVAGLGCGGYSRLGMRQGGDDTGAVNVVRRAMDLGFNCFDTARAYGTEAVVGKAIAGQRDQVIISTKTMFMEKDGSYMAADRLIASLDKSLERMGTDYVDIFSFHGVTLPHLDACVERFVPALQDQIQKGKIRHLGITESFMHDPTHEMLKMAIPLGCFDMAMVGFNFLNPGARDDVFPLAQQHGVGTLVMHAVRRALSQPDVLKETVAGLIEQGEIDPGSVNSDDPVDFLNAHSEVLSVVEAAYRFCRHEPGVSSVLTGTGSESHLTSNAQAISAPPLPDVLLGQLQALFGRVRSVSGD